MNTIAMRIDGVKVRELRKRHGLSPAQLTIVSGVDHKTILDIEDGAYHPETNFESVWIANSLADALDCGAEGLML